MKFLLFISHHNFLIADHQISLCPQQGIEVYPTNVDPSDLDYLIQKLKPRLLLMSRQNYSLFMKKTITSSPFELLLVATKYLDANKNYEILYPIHSINSETLAKIHKLGGI